jgi:hypothetical protein
LVDFFFDKFALLISVEALSVFPNKLVIKIESHFFVLGALLGQLLNIFKLLEVVKKGLDVVDVLFAHR